MKKVLVLSFVFLAACVTPRSTMDRCIECLQSCHTFEHSCVENSAAFDECIKVEEICEANCLK